MPGHTPKEKAKKKLGGASLGAKKKKKKASHGSDHRLEPRHPNPRR